MDPYGGRGGSQFIKGCGGLQQGDQHQGSYSTNPLGGGGGGGWFGGGSSSANDKCGGGGGSGYVGGLEDDARTYQGFSGTDSGGGRSANPYDDSIGADAAGANMAYATFAQGTQGTTDCPSGFKTITSKDECEEALIALNLCHRSRWEGSVNFIPVGCSHRPNHCGSHDWHWNESPTGQGA